MRGTHRSACRREAGKAETTRTPSASCYNKQVLVKSSAGKHSTAFRANILLGGTVALWAWRESWGRFDIRKRKKKIPNSVKELQVEKGLLLHQDTNPLHSLSCNLNLWTNLKQALHFQEEWQTKQLIRTERLSAAAKCNQKLWFPWFRLIYQCLGPFSFFFKFQICIQSDRLSRLVEGMRPAQAVLLGSFLACHQRASVWSTISSTSPFLKPIPASAQGMVGSCCGL